jgi:hypothetical protein
MKQIPTSKIKPLLKGIKKEVSIYESITGMFSSFRNCTIELDDSESKIVIHEKHDNTMGAYGSLYLFKVNSIKENKDEKSTLIKIEAGNIYEHKTIILEIKP